MSVRTFEGSSLEPIPFSLPTLLSGYATPTADARARQAAAFSKEDQWPADEIPTAIGCLRGFCWAIGIECAAVFCVFGVWRFLR
jgi:hypothetical protein